VTAMDDPGRKLSEALRARAGQSGLHAFPAPATPPAPGSPSGRYAPASPVPHVPAGPGATMHGSSVQQAAPPHVLATTAGHQGSGRWAETAPGGRRRAEPPSPMNQVWWALGVALLGGAVLGCALALLSVLVPGLLPALG